LNSPAVWFTLPQVLTEEEVTRLLEQPDLSQPYGLRDRAMLEVLYGGGLRVSELIHLELKDLRLKDGFLVCKGKGNKERIVPIGRQAGRWLSTYLRDIRPGWDKKGSPVVSLADAVQALPARESGSCSSLMARRRACLRKSIPIFSATLLLPICWSMGLICVQFKCCSATVRLQPLRYIPTSAGKDSEKFMTVIIPGPEGVAFEFTACQLTKRC